MHNDYADRKNGRKPIGYLHPDLEEVLGDTYGLMIYQESMMRVAQKVAGYSLADADNLRKACGKKIRELIAAEREKFVDGCDDRATGELGTAPVRHHRALRRLRLQQEPRLRLRARRLPDRVPQGALPGRVPRRLLTSVKSSLDKAAIYIAECRAMGIKVLNPDINRSVTDFAALAPEEVPPGRHPAAGSPGAITFGLSAVRNVGAGLVTLLLAERDATGRSPASMTSPSVFPSRC